MWGFATKQPNRNTDGYGSYRTFPSLISPRLTFPLFTHRERLYLSLSSSSWIPLTGSVSFCGFVNLVTKSRNNLQI
ncbi:hypothetical protein L1887_29733 [Cichorium endivia]|nr:hypothetical protein L1887_29733 [Cichorium endivia]